MRVTAVSLIVGMLLAGGSIAAAQDPPPPIGPVAFDIRGTLVSMPGGEALAASRGLNEAELPNRGPGLSLGAHVYPFTLRPVTFGLGGQLLLVRAGSSPEDPLRSVSSHLTSMAPTLSLNFGTGDGWSYLSGGVGRTRWSIQPDGASAQPADEDWVTTLDYGGGARWFVRPHLAFHFDLRFYSIGAGQPQAALPAAPAVHMFVISAGISVK